MLNKEHLGGCCLDREVGLDLILLFSSEWRICEDDIESVFLLDTSYICPESILFTDIGIMNSMENHIHNSEYVGKRSFFIKHVP